MNTYSIALGTIALFATLAGYDFIWRGILPEVVFFRCLKRVKALGAEQSYMDTLNAKTGTPTSMQELFRRCGVFGLQAAYREVLVDLKRSDA